MDTPSSLIPHECPMVGVEEWFNLAGHVSHLSCFDWLVSVSVWDTNLGQQERKPIKAY